MPGSGAHTVLIADGNTLFRAGFKQLLEHGSTEGWEVVGEADSADDAMRLAGLRHPEVVCVDPGTAGQPIVEAVQAVADRFHDMHILVVTAAASAADVEAAFDAGATGFVLKSATPEELFAALDAVSAGERFIQGSLGAEIVAARRTDPHEGLTERELSVVRYAALGYTNREIAGLSSTSVRTVEGHRSTAMAKLGLTRRHELVRWALRTSLIGPDDGTVGAD